MKEYCKQYQKPILLALLFSLICFGFFLTNHTIGIDEETWILENENSLLWLLQGRFGIQFLNFFLTDYGRFAPFLWDFLSVVIWYMAGVVFSFALFSRKDNESKIVPLFFFLAYFSSVPFVEGEIFAFSQFNLQISIGMLACSVSMLLLCGNLERKNRRAYVFAIVLLVFSFSIYQAYICVFVTVVVAYCLTGFMRKEKNLWKKTGLFSSVCVISIILYYAINLLITFIIGSAGYLSENYIGWFEETSIWKALFLALANIVRVSFGITIYDETIYGGIVIGIITISFIIWGLSRLFAEKTWKRRGLLLFYGVSLVCAPFILYVLLGTYKTHGRMLLAIPLAGAVELWLILTYVKSVFWKQLCIIISSYLLFLNARNMNMLYYEADIVYQYDKELANQVMYDIQREGMDYHKKPVVFIGRKEMDPIPIEEAGTIGGSLFEWDDGNNYRMRDFIQTLGFELLTPNEAQINEALALSGDMEVWPEENGIIESDNVIVVYFSEPTEQWYAVNGVQKN